MQTCYHFHSDYVETIYTVSQQTDVHGRYAMLPFLQCMLGIISSAAICKTLPEGQIEDRLWGGVSGLDLANHTGDLKLAAMLDILCMCLPRLASRRLQGGIHLEQIPQVGLGSLCCAEGNVVELQLCLGRRVHVHHSPLWLRDVHKNDSIVETFNGPHKVWSLLQSQNFGKESAQTLKYVQLCRYVGKHKLFWLPRKMTKQWHVVLNV